MSHELRTPLNAILGFSEVMKGEMLGPIRNGSYKEYAANIHDSGRHLLQLINEVLDLSRIEAGRYELQESPVGLAAVVEDCLRLLNLRVESKGLNVEFVIGKDLDPLWADERAIRQICLNLLSNALKFTPRGGRIAITVGSTPEGGQMLVVKDTGPGIPKEELPRVMQAFGQGSLAHQTAEGGTGLGLPIVQNLVSLHGGTFRLRSMLRKGTEAIVWLPPGRVLRAAKGVGPGLGPGDAVGNLGGTEPEPWWRLRAGRTSQQATTGC
jgi:two-component system cell cycle sensor histidine kinase PleC